MANAPFEKMKNDPLAMSVASALALANEAALLHGTDPAKSIVSIIEESTPSGSVWCINYVKRDGVDRRGGDLIVFVDVGSQTIQRVLRGQ